MILIFKAKITKANNNGAGFIKLGKAYQDYYNIGEQCKIDFSLPKKNICFYAKIRELGRKGIYVPAEIIEILNLELKNIVISLQNLEGFFTKISYDGRIYPSKGSKEIGSKTK